jgi:hypothetical protein
MKTILIDPKARTIVEAVFNGGLDSIYKLIEARPFDAVRINSAGDCLYVDDEGLMRSNQSFFAWSGFPQPIAGRAILVGTDDEGESISPVGETLASVKRKVRFLSHAETLSMATKADTEADAYFSRMAPVGVMIVRNDTAPLIEEALMRGSEKDGD